MAMQGHQDPFFLHDLGQAPTGFVLVGLFSPRRGGSFLNKFCGLNIQLGLCLLLWLWLSFGKAGFVNLGRVVGLVGRCRWFCWFRLGILSVRKFPL